MKGACVSSRADMGEGVEKVMMKLCSEDLAYRDAAEGVSCGCCASRESGGRDDVGG